MSRAWLAIVLFSGTAAAAPSYTAAGIVNASNYSPGPFAPNSVLSIFGSGLSRSARSLTAEDIRGNMLPTELNFTQVLVDNTFVPLLYVSDTQVNFLIPAKQSLGEARIQVVSQSQRGPVVVIQVVDAAPALFLLADGYAIATHADNALITSESPARGGEIIVIYLTGLGKTIKNPDTGEIPPYVSEIVARESLQVSTGGKVEYAGLTPGSAGLYQINLTLPATIGPDPELRVTVGSFTSSAGVKLAAR